MKKLNISNIKKTAKFILHIITFYPNGLILLFKIFFKKEITKLKINEKLTIYGDESSLLLEIADEIFYQRIYNPSFCLIKRGDIVMDIGANVGVYSLFATCSGARRVYAVEPLLKNIKLIKINLKKNKITNIKVIHNAVYSHNGLAKYYLKRKNPHGSLFNQQQDVKSKKLYVRTATLRTIIKSQGIERIDFLKIDAEGSEWGIISTTPFNIWKKIDRVSLEYHDLISGVSHLKIVRYLSVMGYNLKIKKINENMGFIYAFRKKSI